MDLLRLLLVVHQFGSFFLVQTNILIGHFLGLACRPTDILIALFPWSLLSRDSNPGWGDWRRSLWWFGLFVFLVLFMGNFYVSVLCFSRDWA